jgi:hypothetical protein
LVAEVVRQIAEQNEFPAVPWEPVGTPIAEQNESGFGSEGGTADCGTKRIPGAGCEGGATNYGTKRVPVNSGAVYLASRDGHGNRPL